MTPLVIGNGHTRHGHVVRVVELHSRPIKDPSKLVVAPHWRISFQGRVVGHLHRSGNDVTLLETLDDATCSDLESGIFSALERHVRLIQPNGIPVSEPPTADELNDFESEDF